MEKGILVAKVVTKVIPLIRIPIRKRKIGGRYMKVLSLIQPWASLIALGEKKIETRSWKTDYRGPLLIHAGKKIDDDICRQYPFTDILAEYDLLFKDQMPTGVIIAKCNLVDCLKIENPVYKDGLFRPKLENGQLVDLHNEYLFGDYTPGRYAWLLENAEQLDNPIPAKGKLRLWEYQIE